MFWGLNLKPNRKYSQKTEKSFHISQAALDAGSSQGGATQIFISIENQKFLLCTLRKDGCEQVMLDLNFSEGNEICFQSVGSGNVTLSGYVMDDMSDDFMDGEEEEEDDESVGDIEELDLRNKLTNAKKANKKAEKRKDLKAAKSDEEDEDEDEDDDDGSDDDVEAEDDEEESAEDDDEEELDDEEEDSEEEEEDPEPKAKQAKLEKPEKQQNGVAKQKDQQAVKKSKKDLKKEKQQQQKAQAEKQQPKTGGERVLSGGVKVVDLRVGNGPEAKPGKRTQVYYEGRLLSNNKVFDSLKSGAGFKFSLGRGEVIKGWDVGVVGMKVGGKRRITCPPHMAYGSRGSPPAIPPNSTLVFEVELKAAN